MTTSIGALQRNASAIVRKVVASGTPEEITDRGRVVAILVPPPESSGLERLREAGATRLPVPGAVADALAGTSDLAEVGLTDSLAEQRDTER